MLSPVSPSSLFLSAVQLWQAGNKKILQCAE
jgi:hypothetical protein